MPFPIDVPNLGMLNIESGFVELESCGDGIHATGKDGVVAVLATGDRKVEFIVREDHTLAWIRSAMGYPAYYPVHSIKCRKPVRAVLMDLDGTSVRSEHFWIRMIEMATASLLDNPSFELCDDDVPYVSGHSVSEHLQYAVSRYCPDQSVEEARRFYFEHTHRELAEIVAGRGQADAFTPTEGLKEFLLALKDQDIRIGLVTSGLHEKAWPEILSAFRSLDLGDPNEFYDAIITAGFPLRKGEAGTLGELSPKPHPWLYAEVARVGLGIPFEDRHSVVGIEDSGAGVCSVRLAGFTTIGLAGGNIDESGTRPLCSAYCDSLEEILNWIMK